MKGTAGARARYSDDSGNSVAVLACDKVCDWAGTGAGGSGQAREEMQDRGRRLRPHRIGWPSCPQRPPRKPRSHHWITG